MRPLFCFVFSSRLCQSIHIYGKTDEPPRTPVQFQPVNDSLCLRKRRANNGRYLFGVLVFVWVFGVWIVFVVSWTQKFPQHRRVTLSDMLTTPEEKMLKYFEANNRQRVGMSTADVGFQRGSKSHLQRYEWCQQIAATHPWWRHKRDTTSMTLYERVQNNTRTLRKYNLDACYTPDETAGADDPC